ncbi:MAG: GNAT family N-acetyltransferase [Acidobacteria bacterium]|nr:GNAT family N-acetyltransferase [Acidobacteriota bacterium]
MRELGIINAYRLDLRCFSADQGHSQPSHARDSCDLKVVRWKAKPWRIFAASMIRHFCAPSRILQWYHFLYWWLHYLFCRPGKKSCFAVRLVSDRGRLVHYAVTRSADFRFPFMKDKDLQVGPVWTDPNYRSSGLGTESLAAAVSAAAREGWQAVWWLCRDDNLPSNRLAKRAGFEYVGPATRTRACGFAAMGIYQLCRETSYVMVTEAPGSAATADQLAMQYTRYALAAQYSHGKRVLEVACGCGTGLGFLARSAERVVGGDIDEENCRVAAAVCRGKARIKICRLDAHDLPFPASSIDVVALFEAIYYLGDCRTFLREAHRVLAPEGVLVISSANCDWSAFNPSLFSTRYFNAAELYNTLTEQGFDTQMQVGFPDPVHGVTGRIIRGVRLLAIRLNLIPKSMKSKEWLKRLVSGKLYPMPSDIPEGSATQYPLLPADRLSDLRSHRVLYAVARKSNLPQTHVPPAALDIPAVHSVVGQDLV